MKTIAKTSLFLLLTLAFHNCNQMKKTPKNLSRYEAAVFEKEEAILKQLNSKQLKINELEIFLRAFKKEEELEIWAKNKSKTIFKKLKTYSFCRSSGKLGPKRKEGDLQIPEGVYHINRFNDKSNFHLSLGLNYPNKSDLIFADKKAPGSDIFIHGGCQTVGCIPITDDLIKELFVTAKMAQAAGQSKIPVHIFPFKMTDSKLKTMSKQFPQHFSFWKNLKNIFALFEDSNELKPIFIDKKGQYMVK